MLQINKLKGDILLRELRGN